VRTCDNDNEQRQGRLPDSAGPGFKTNASGDDTSTTASGDDRSTNVSGDAGNQQPEILGKPQQDAQPEPQQEPQPEPQWPQQESQHERQPESQQKRQQESQLLLQYQRRGQGGDVAFDMGVRQEGDEEAVVNLNVGVRQKSLPAWLTRFLTGVGSLVGGGPNESGTLGKVSISNKYLEYLLPPPGSSVWKMDMNFPRGRRPGDGYLKYATDQLKQNPWLFKFITTMTLVGTDMNYFVVDGIAGPDGEPITVEDIHRLNNPTQLQRELYHEFGSLCFRVSQFLQKIFAAKGLSINHQVRPRLDVKVDFADDYHRAEGKPIQDGHLEKFSRTIFLRGFELSDVHDENGRPLSFTDNDIQTMPGYDENSLLNEFYDLFQDSFKFMIKLTAPEELGYIRLSHQTPDRLRAYMGDDVGRQCD
jgi:hypothetical protein